MEAFFWTWTVKIHYISIYNHVRLLVNNFSDVNFFIYFYTIQGNRHKIIQKYQYIYIHQIPPNERMKNRNSHQYVKPNNLKMLRSSRPTWRLFHVGFFFCLFSSIFFYRNIYYSHPMVTIALYQANPYGSALWTIRSPMAFLVNFSLLQNKYWVI